MSFTRDIPQPNDLISASQSQILNNFNGSDDSFGRDHYAFSNTSGNTGFHNQVTQPLITGGVHPTTTTNPIIYAMQDSVNLGVIQYSKGPSDAIASPITFLQSPSAPIVMNPGDTINIFNFTGLTRAFCSLRVGNFEVASKTINSSEVLFVDNGFFSFNSYAQSGSILGITSSGRRLQVINNTGLTLNEVRWTLQFYRVEP